MLYGTEEIRKRILKDAIKYADENGLKLVWGALCGSISKGFQYFDSDYDTRFLYVKKDFPNEVMYTPQAREKDVVYRYYPDEQLPYEWIPFWEFTSFLQYLSMPGLDDKFSLGLYNIVSWTFLSPYTWDPYGIQNRIIPIINSIFVKEYKIGYHVNEIEAKLKELESLNIVAKNYLHMLYSALVIEYCINYNLAPPTHASSLAVMSKYIEVYDRMKKIVTESREKAQKYIASEQDNDMHVAHFSVMVSQDEYLTNYIYDIYEQGKRLMKQDDFLSCEQKMNIQKKIQNMYKVVHEAMQRIPVKDIS